MNMNMSGSNGILSVPTEHIPGLVALVALPLLVWLAVCAIGWLSSTGIGWAGTVDRRLRGLSTVKQVTLFALVVGAVVHLVLVPTHWGDERVTATLFIIDAFGFIVAVALIWMGRRSWRFVSVVMLGGTAAVYAWYILRGWETADLVGLVTTAVELAAALILLIPARTSVARPRWSWAVAVPLALFSLLGATAIANASSADTTTGPPAAQAASNTATMPGMTSPSTTTKLALTTASPAGTINWPDSMPSTMPGMKMVTPNCTAQPTAAQQEAAVNLVNQTTAAVAPFKSLAAAKAAGYVPVTPTGQRVVHYINYSIARRESLLDPNAIPVLVYVNTQHGAVLSAAMYMAFGASAANPPQPGGCLTQWHTHDDLCFNGSTVVGNNSQNACSAGSVNKATRPMMHVWMSPVAGGPLAPDPAAISQVLAASQLPPLPVPNGIA